MFMKNFGKNLYRTRKLLTNVHESVGKNLYTNFWKEIILTKGMNKIL
jgi:hypothetical protein